MMIDMQEFKIKQTWSFW